MKVLPPTMHTSPPPLGGPRRLSLGYGLGLLGLLAGASACGDQTVTIPVGSSAGRAHALAPLPADAPQSARVEAAGGYSTSFDARGVPTQITATGRIAAPRGASAEQAARWHLQRFLGAQGSDAAVLAGARLKAVHDLGAAGKIVHLQARIGGHEVYPGDVKVLLRENLELTAISGALPKNRMAAGKGAFRLTPQDALAQALSHRFGTAVRGEQVRVAPGAATVARVEGDEFVTLQLAAGGPLHLSQARGKPVYFRQDKGLVPAYFVEFFAGLESSTSSDAFRYLIAADDGRVLERADLTASEAFNYRVWAQATGDKRPLDGPQADFTPHPTGMADKSKPAFIAPTLVSVEGLNKNPQGVADPWLAATAVQTLGNNVDAYGDHNPPDGYSNGDVRATTTGTRAFDRVYDTGAEPPSSPGQMMAAMTQLFYNINWLHDDWYGAGFNEAAGNAQLNNFGRGGAGGDLIKAEAQDNYLGGSRNNANMSTPSDGLSPRMQVFLWSGEEIRSLTLAPSGLKPATGSAAFGPRNFNVTGAVVLGDDGAAPLNSDACQPLTNNVTGKVVLVDRGNCSFKIKTLNVQTAGGIGVIVANNVAATTPQGMADDPTTMASITIPALLILQTDGVALKAALMAGAVNATLQRTVEPERDGGLDNMIIAHEWGHYLHHRLSNCGGTQQCGGLSEGWADFVSLHMALRPGDNLDGVYAAAIYGSVSFGDAGYFGIRRYPYSVDTTKNGLSFRHLGDGVALPMVPNQAAGPNSEVHNAGEVWSSMLWEAYIALHKDAKASGKRTFDEVRQLFAKYLVRGLQLAPTNATYTEARDAILAAISASDGNDLKLVAQAFARRGAGTCAVGPARDSVTLTGVVESMEVKPQATLGAVTLDDSIASCDKDGVLDAKERGKLSIVVSNSGPAPLMDATVTLKAGAGLTLSATTLTVPMLAPYGSKVLTVDVTPDAALKALAEVSVDVELKSASSCQASAPRKATFRVNFDDATATSSSDDVESAKSAWTRSGEQASDIWNRMVDTGVNHVWLGTDWGEASDTQLTSPALQVSASQPFVISFEHRYSFEFEIDNTMMPVYYDGAVIEVSSDAGKTWQDLSMYVEPGYIGTITNVSGNPLATRKAYGGESAGWPARKKVSFDLGTKLAGKSVQVRFRIGTDAAAGAFGWELDNLTFSGITNKPFSSLIADAARCPVAPLAKAGDDQTVVGGATVLLDATSSTDENGDKLTYTWAQTAGPAVTLVSTSSAITGFTTPQVDKTTRMTFQVTASDGVLTATDSVDVIVTPVVLKGGCSAAPGSAGAASGAALGALALLLAAGLRRRRLS